MTCDLRFVPAVYSADFCDMLNHHFLVQCNFNPTRMLNEADGNIIDLILSKTPDLVSNIEVLTDHFNSDHFPVTVVSILDFYVVALVSLSQGKTTTLKGQTLLN